MPWLAELSGFYLSQSTSELLWILWQRILWIVWRSGFPRYLSYAGKVVWFFFFLGSWLYCRHQSLRVLSLAKRSVKTSIVGLFWAQGTIVCGSGKNVTKQCFLLDQCMSRMAPFSGSKPQLHTVIGKYCQFLCLGSSVTTLREHHSSYLFPSGCF